MIPAFIRLAIGLVCGGVLLPGCIERDNWWDPYNGCHPLEELPIFTETSKTGIKALQQKAVGSDTGLGRFDLDFQKQVAANEAIWEKNSAVLDTVLDLIATNARIDSANRTVPVDSAVFKQIISRRLASVQEGPAMISGRMAIDSARDSAERLILISKSYCPRQVVLTNGYIDSVRAYFSERLRKWDRERDNVDGFNKRVRAANRAADSINNKVHVLDSLAVVYNDSLKFSKLPHLTDPVEIQKNIDSIGPGSVIALGVDSINVLNFRFLGRGVPGKGWARVEGLPGKKTVVTSVSWIEIKAGTTNIRFSNLIFRDAAKARGVQLDQADSIQFYGCIFSDFGTFGASVNKSSNILFENCEFLRNGSRPESSDTVGRGIRLSDSRINIVMNNVLVAGNTGYGIDITSSSLTLDRATIAHNTLDGVRYKGPTGTGDFSAKGGLFAFNGGFGIYRQNENASRDFFVEASGGNRFFGNTSGEMGGSPAMITANQPFESADPAFVNSAVFDYRIGQASVLSGTVTGYQYP
jgi:hypothetical protein